MSTTARQLIIFEGPDGAGKSVAAAAVASSLDVDVTHHGPYVGEDVIGQRYLDSMAPALSKRRHVVMDRSWLSEPIYGAVFRGGANRITATHARMLQRCALARDAIIVLCLPPLETCLANYRKRKEVEYLDNEDQLREVWHLYNKFAAPGGLDVLRYDYTKATSAALTADLRRVVTSRVPNDGPGVGSWRKPNQVALLVGDQMGKRIFDGRDSTPEVPFVSFSRAGCADWLTQQLEDAGVPETDLYWINARAADDSITDAKFICTLQPRRVIALGDVAAKWCKRELRSKFIEVSHPQFWKRFHMREAYPLIKELTE